jgi:hypothetical protein
MADVPVSPIARGEGDPDSVSSMSPCIVMNDDGYWNSHDMCSGNKVLRTIEALPIIFIQPLHMRSSMNTIVQNKILLETE